MLVQVLAHFILAALQEEQQTAPSGHSHFFLCTYPETVSISSVCKEKGGGQNGCYLAPVARMPPLSALPPLLLPAEV